MNPTLASILTTATTTVEDVINGSPDTCTVYSRSYSNAGDGSTTPTETAVASNVKCLYVARGDSSTQFAGARLAHVTHKLYLIASAASRAITPDYKIVVAARSPIPALTFEQPILLEETMGPLVVVGAMIKK